MAELLQTLSTSSFVLAVVFLAVSVVLFFVFDIKNVIGELTGKTATTEIARIREQGTSRQHKGRSLQSIVLDGEGVSTDFSLDKLDLDADVSGSTNGDGASSDGTNGDGTSSPFRDPHVRLSLHGRAISEAETSMLGFKADESSELATSFLGDIEQSEQATGLLVDVEVREQLTVLLASDETSEQSTGLLASDATHSEQTTSLLGEDESGKQR